MYKGGSNYTPQAARIIRFAGLIVPFLLIGYGYLFAPSASLNHNFSSGHILTITSIAWAALALWQFLAPGKSTTAILVQLSLYHLVSVVYVLFVTGVFTPFIACWILLMIAASIYFGRPGVLASVAIFLAVVMVDITLWGAVKSSVVLFDMAVLVAILLCAMVVISVSRAQAIDRNELRRSREQEVLQRDRIMAIINNLADAVMSIDKKGIIRVYNAASLDLLDTNDSLNGHHIDTVLPLLDANDRPIELSSMLAASKAVDIHDNVWYTFDDGERIRLELTISPIRRAFSHTSGANDGHVVILRDITKAKSLEEERDEFISVVSHELRTPITVVEGSLSNLEIMISKDTIGRDVIRGAIALAHEQTLYLAKMVNDLSTLSRAERGIADTKELINIEELLHSLYDTYAPQAHDKGLTFDLDADPQLGCIEASRLYIEELLQNLITNAIKYTKKGSVKLIAKRQGATVTFSIKDTGIGISKSEQAKIFDKFYRSEDYRTRETGGTGLGLYVSTKLARKLQTEVILKSRLNYGSTFSFTLPIVD